MDDKLAGKYALGDKITFSGAGTDAELSNNFETLNYTVVGFVRSPQFIEKSTRGTSGIGKGTADAFAAIPESDFKLPVYTEAYLSFKDTTGVKAYSPEYEGLIEQHTKSVEQAMSSVPEARLAEMRAEGEKELSSGRGKVAAAEKQLTDLKRQPEVVQQGQAANMKAIADGLVSAKAELVAGSKSLQN